MAVLPLSAILDIPRVRTYHTKKPSRFVHALSARSLKKVGIDRFAEQTRSATPSNASHCLIPTTTRKKHKVTFLLSRKSTPSSLVVDKVVFVCFYKKHSHHSHKKTVGSADGFFSLYPLVIFMRISAPGSSRTSAVSFQLFETPSGKRLSE